MLVWIWSRSHRRLFRLCARCWITASTVFEQQKKEKEAKKNQKVVEVKETRLSLNIDTNDFNTKLNQTAKFLAAGHKVKVSIRFRGREMAHSALGADVLKRFAEALPQASMDKQPVLEGRTMSILLIPKPNKD